MAGAIKRLRESVLIQMSFLFAHVQHLHIAVGSRAVRAAYTTNGARASPPGSTQRQSRRRWPAVIRKRFPPRSTRRCQRVISVTSLSPVAHVTARHVSDASLGSIITASLLARALAKQTTATF